MAAYSWSIITIMIEQWSDGDWRVVAYVNGDAVQTSPAIVGRAEAWRQAKVVDKQLRAKFPGKRQRRRALT